jgi:hypothetical protein
LASEEVLLLIPYPPPHKPGGLVAEAELCPHQIQDLAAGIGDLVQAAVGHDLKLRIRVELGGGTAISNDAVQEVSAIPKSIANELELR